MAAKEFNFEFLRQIRTAPETVVHMGKQITTEYFDSVFDPAVLKKTNRVILTGCGDSYCAALAAKPVFENIQTANTTGMVPGTRTEAERCIEFTRYYDTYHRFWLSGTNRVQALVCGVSISGAVKRVEEAMLRTNQYNGVSVAFTDNLDSGFAQAAQYAVKLNAPKGSRSPGLTSYIASTFALTHFGLYYSTLRGQMSKENADGQRAAMQRYAAKFTPELMKEIEERAQALAKKWIDMGVDLMDFIGDGPDYATAFFGSAKMVEAFGGLTTYDDSEDWNHINYFNRTPEKVGTFIICNESSPSFRRVLETIRTSVALGRPTVVITDASPSYFPAACEVFSLPKAEYRWCNPLMQHIPMDYVAAYTGILLDREAYRADCPLHQLDPKSARFRESKIVIV